MNTRRSARPTTHEGVRFCEETGLVSTSRSRAAARMDAAKTRAISYGYGLR